MATFSLFIFFFHAGAEKYYIFLCTASLAGLVANLTITIKKYSCVLQKLCKAFIEEILKLSCSRSHLSVEFQMHVNVWYGYGSIDT